MEEIRKEVLRQAQERHQAELERIVEKKDVEKERELLHLRTEFQDKLQIANEESTTKIQALYERIEQIRKEHEEDLKKQEKEYEQQIEELKKKK
ncbi:hypothetical protein ACWKW1_25320 [Brevibacillus parabrevis]